MKRKLLAIAWTGIVLLWAIRLLMPQQVTAEDIGVGDMVMANFSTVVIFRSSSPNTIVVDGESIPQLINGVTRVVMQQGQKAVVRGDFWGNDVFFASPDNDGTRMVTVQRTVRSLVREPVMVFWWWALLFGILVIFPIPYCGDQISLVLWLRVGGADWSRAAHIASSHIGIDWMIFVISFTVAMIGYCVALVASVI